MDPILEALLERIADSLETIAINTQVIADHSGSVEMWKALDAISQLPELLTIESENIMEITHPAPTQE